MRQWCRNAAHVAALELRQVLSHPLEWLCGFAAPVFWCVVLLFAFNSGVMTGLPVGLVDADGSALSRQAVSALSAIPSIELKSFASAEDADEALRARRTYATITLPKNFELDQKRERGAPVSLEINKTYYAVGTILEVDVKTALSSLKLSSLAVRSTAQSGGSFRENATRLRASIPDVLFMGNVSFNFVAYLLPTFIPGLMALGALLGFVCMLTREWREGGLRELIDEAGESVSAAMVGKFIPWVSVWLVLISVWTAGWAGWAGWGAAGPILFWFTAGWLLILSMAALTSLAVALAPSWVIALSASICLIAPTFPFTGFSFPLDAMTPGARLFGLLLPLTHYLEAQAQIWILGSPLDAVAKTQLEMLVFPVLCFAISIPLLTARVRKWERRERMSENLTVSAEKDDAFSDAPDRPRTGFLAAFGLTLRHAFLSRDTIAILGGAVAFYLIFYGWPYGTQQVEGIPVGIVDLDRSAAAGRFISALEAAPAADVRFVVHSAAEGMDAFRRRTADVLVTIPPEYTEDLARGRNTTIHVLGNGAYPVKARAVQGAVSGVVGDARSRIDLASVMTPGADGTMMKAATLSAPGVLVTYRFNEISGYGNFTVPLVGPVIVQAVLLMGIGMSVGGWLYRRPRRNFVRDVVARPWCEGLGLFFAYWSIAFGWLLYMQGFGFLFGEYGAMANPPAVLLVCALYAAAVVAFGLAIVTTVRSNAWTAPLTVIISAPALFISGAVWPVENMHPLAAGVAQILPSTPGIYASAAAAQDGAVLADVLPACAHLLLLTVLYGSFFLMRVGAIEEFPRKLSVNDID